ncbi:MAG TPA: LysR substrate-binding domain-containing protein, partial [Candidatus Acidoferrum sp.]
MVLRKLGLAFLPVIAVYAELRGKKLRTLEISDTEALRRSLDVIVPRRHPLSHGARGLLDCLRAAARAIPEGKASSRG